MIKKSYTVNSTKYVITIGCKAIKYSQRVNGCLLNTSKYFNFYQKKKVTLHKQ